MSKYVKLIVFIFVVLLFAFAVFAGIQFGKLQIAASVSQLKDANQNLESKIETASVLSSVKYPETTKKLEKSYETFSIQKNKYDELVQYASENQKGIYETKQYDISYLWKTIGKYGTRYNLTINMDVKKTEGNNLYDLYFTVSGTYVNTSEFIAAIENDSDFYFRIYNFKMTGRSEIVDTSFYVKDVNINPSTITGTNSYMIR